MGDLGGGLFGRTCGRLAGRLEGWELDREICVSVTFLSTFGSVLGKVPVAVLKMAVKGGAGREWVSLKGKENERVNRRDDCIRYA